MSFMKKFLGISNNAKAKTQTFKSVILAQPPGFKRKLSFENKLSAFDSGGSV